MSQIAPSNTPTPQFKVAPHSNHYRPDIDGLRAIAVLAVVLFHAFPNTLRGGFVGVDIFFVISGFLITTIIVNGLEQGKFRFADFYGRRIKRIFPALLLVLIACLGFGWFALLADEYKQLGKHVAGGAGFISNLLFWKEAGYFDNSADTKPLLHLWSLGIEEQFYMLWPVMLWAAWRKRINLLSLILLVLVVSFALNIATAQTDSVGVFYGLHTRGWELLIGAFLAHISQRQLELPKWLTSAVAKVNTALTLRDPQASAPRIASVSRNTLCNLASAVGAFLLLLSFVVISKVNSFPGWWALLPTLGTALLIGAGAQAWFNRTVLANRAMVGIGLISFPLYLWHWPLLSFARIIESETPTYSIRTAAIGVAFVLAWLTYQLLERQIRFTQRRVTVFLLLLMVSVGMTGGWITAMERSPTAQQTVQDQLEGPLWRYTENTLCKENHPAGYLYFCMRSAVAAPDLILLGDSYANHLYAGIIKNEHLSHHSVLSYGACNFDLIPTTKIGCDAQDEIIKNTPTLRYAILNNWWGVADENGHFSYVLDNKKHTSNSELNKELLKKKLNERILLLKSKNIKVVIFEPKPILEYDIKACFARPFKKPAKDCVISQDSVKKQQEDLLSVFAQIKKLHPDVGFFEQNTLFLEDDSFRTIKNGMPLLRDNGHYSVYGSIEIMKKFTAWAELNMPGILR